MSPGRSASEPFSPGPRVAQRAVAALLTVLFFALVVVGFGAAGRAVDQAGWGYLVGAGCCLVMVAAGLRSSRSTAASADSAD